MSELVLEARGLVKVYRGHRALDGLDLEVPQGAVLGLLGPNGAGKSTTLRVVLGLVRPSRGEVKIFGRPLAKERLSLLRRVGSLVEGAAFYGQLSALDNLRWLGELAGGASRERIASCLDEVGLSARGGVPVKTYSTGMRQRLGLAAAILHDPELVVLDEPLSGLDPPAVLLVRGLIRRLAAEGKTVLISSHALHEVEQVCDRVTIIRSGRVLASGTVSELLEPQAVRLELSVDDLDAATTLLKADPVVESLEQIEGEDGSPRLMLQLTQKGEAARLNRALVEAGLAVNALVPRRPSLEELFHSLAGDAEAGERPPEPGESA
ncbi:MAG: ABC transporter ATP-binding protein [Planctomycetes bacterium]|nr:ABC transporter ATP-binding protein [Planctomycetota bacterium]